MKTSLIIVLCIIAYLLAGLLVFFCSLLCDRLMSGYIDSREKEVMWPCIFLWPIFLVGMIAIASRDHLYEMMQQIVEKVAKFIERKARDKWVK